ncbi:hypothetical protein [Fredinandcohnia sp. 179-A 10B2 NHS]|uniref:hypothetical protein n=1 Tax=Fredinandcohnia sp. 179-A 10B2 NHS TaxID=3235176 RepID=UPI0039A37CF7
MLLDVLFSIIFILSIYYLIRYRLNIKKAADLTNNAIFPQREEEFQSILVPGEWKEMQPLSKDTRSYKYVEWGTLAAMLFILIIVVAVLTSDFLGSSFFSIAYILFAIIRIVQHRGNFYVLSNGIILHGRYYSFRQVKAYEIEQIIRWHDLYGLDDRLNNSYKLTIKVKSVFPQQNFVVIEDKTNLEKIIALLRQNWITGTEQPATTSSLDSNFINK